MDIKLFGLKRKSSQLPVVKDTSIWYPKEERAAKRLRKDSALLHIPNPESFWSIRTYEGRVEEGGRLLEVHNERAHSFNRNAFNVDLSVMGGVEGVGTFGAGLISLKRQDGVIVGSGLDLGWDTEVPEGVGSGYRGPAGSTAADNLGILVGTGSTASTFEDFALETKIIDGTGSGELSYVESEPHVQTWSGGPLTFDIDHARFFNNNSGGTIGVRELGLFGDFQSSSVSNTILVSHDVLGMDVDVLDTGQLKVTYTITLTYPS